MTFEQIKSKIQYGDYNLLQKILKSPSVQAARMKFLREDEDAINGMKQIQQNREEFIKNFKNQPQNEKTN